QLGEALLLQLVQTGQARHDQPRTSRSGKPEAPARDLVTPSLALRASQRGDAHFAPAGRLARASSTTLVNAAGSSTARLARVLRFSSTRARWSPAISWP